MILLLCLIGSYTLNNSTVDVYLILLFGAVGYLMRRFDYEPAPLVLAFVLTPIMENALRQSLILSSGCLILAGFLLITSIFPLSRKKKGETNRKAG